MEDRYQPLFAPSTRVRTAAMNMDQPALIMIFFLIGLLYAQDTQLSLSWVAGCAAIALCGAVIALCSAAQMRLIHADTTTNLALWGLSDELDLGQLRRSVREARQRVRIAFAVAAIIVAAVLVAALVPLNTDSLVPICGACALAFCGLQLNRLRRTDRQMKDTLAVIEAMAHEPKPEPV